MIKTAPPEHMVGEEQCQIDDDTHHGSGDGSQRRGEFQVAVCGLDEWAAQKNENI